ncbi:hypothetical protein RCL1_004683 [Eukaryota sp. TZLM3-RCL]
MKKYPNIVLSNVLVKVLLKDTTVTNVELLRRLNGGVCLFATNTNYRKGPDGPKTLCNGVLWFSLLTLACGLAYSKRLKRGKYSSDEEIRRMRQAEKTLDRKELIETLSARDYDEPEFEPEEVAVPEGGVGPQQMEEPIARGELSKLLSEYTNFFSDI